jgi:hypothetical protein
MYVHLICMGVSHLLNSQFYMPTDQQICSWLTPECRFGGHEGAAFLYPLPLFKHPYFPVPTVKAVLLP